MQCLLRRTLLLTAITALASGVACDSSQGGPNQHPPTESIATSVGIPRCIRVSATLISAGEPVVAWSFKLQRYRADGSLEDIAISKVKNENDLSEICMAAAHYSDAVLILAQPTNSEIILSRYLAPSFQNTVGDTSIEALTIDILTTYLSSIITQVHQLPFSGFIGKIAEEDFHKLETRLRLDAEISRGLKSGLLTETTMQQKWNVNVDIRQNIGKQVACLNSQLPSGSFSTGPAFSFAESQPEPLSEASNTFLKPNGLLSAVAGSPIENMTTRINGVSLQGSIFSSIQHFANDTAGAFLQAPSFDATEELDARITFAHLSDTTSHGSLTPCAIGIISVQNNSMTSRYIDAESSICFDVVSNGNLFVIPSDGNRGDWPSSNTEFIAFGDDSINTTFVLGVPGIHSKAQDDGLRVTIDNDSVCLAFARSHELSLSGEMADTASALWYLCQISEDTKIDASQRILKASQSLEVGLRPAAFDSMSRNEAALAIGRASFIHNPLVMNFLKADVRDSLVNFYQGNEANVAFSGKGIQQSYSAFLNGKGDALAQITTGPQGQWMGALRIPSAKAGDFIRFKAPSSEQRPGAYFDIDIQPSCKP